MINRSGFIITKSKTFVKKDCKREIIMRKLKTTIALLTCIVTFLIAVSANASDKTGMNFRQDRVVVELDNEMDMNTFLQHFPYNPNKNYTFLL